jgi:hypothetical protein
MESKSADGYQKKFGPKANDSTYQESYFINEKIPFIWNYSLQKNRNSNL